MIAISPNRQRTTDGTMAKKKAAETNPRQPGTHNPADNRFQDLSIVHMLKLVEDARDSLSEISATLAKAKERGIDHFIVDGATKMNRAITLMEDFSGYVSEGLNKASVKRRRDERGGLTS